jgi:hypothetical protein
MKVISIKKSWVISAGILIVVAVAFFLAIYWYLNHGMALINEKRDKIFEEGRAAGLKEKEADYLRLHPLEMGKPLRVKIFLVEPNGKDTLIRGVLGLKRGHVLKEGEVVIFTDGWTLEPYVHQDTKR